MNISVREQVFTIVFNGVFISSGPVFSMCWSYWYFMTKNHVCVTPSATSEPPDPDRKHVPYPHLFLHWLSIGEIHNQLSDMHRSLDIFLKISRGAAFEKANELVALDIFLNFSLPAPLVKRSELAHVSPCKNTAGKCDDMPSRQWTENWKRQ